MGNDESIYIRLRRETNLDVDPNTLPRLQVKTNLIEMKILTDPFVIQSRLGYSPAIIVEVPDEDEKRLFFISAKSIFDSIEPIREERGALVGLNIRVRKAGSERISPYELEEIAEL